MKRSRRLNHLVNISSRKIPPRKKKKVVGEWKFEAPGHDLNHLVTGNFLKIINVSDANSTFGPKNLWVWSFVGKSWKNPKNYVPRFWGMGDLPPLIGNPYNGYINPYYWVDDHPLLYGNNESLDPGTYVKLENHQHLIRRYPPEV